MRRRRADGARHGAPARGRSSRASRDADLERRSLYEVLRDATTVASVAEAQETLEPVILTPRECQLLGVPQHTTALLTRRRDQRWTQRRRGGPRATSLLRGDRSRYLFKRTVEPDLPRRRDATTHRSAGRGAISA